MSNKAKERKVEILAPAGSMDSLRAAIGAGADAVYMGGSRFGARAFADNPDRKGMLAAIDYAHIHGRKLYMTVNTLLREDEMGEELRSYLKPYYEEGLDAVIVQDAGVMAFVSDEFPGLPIHASTQMSLTMAEGARCFENTPVTRLVNARELGLCELRRLRENSICVMPTVSSYYGSDRMFWRRAGYLDIYLRPLMSIDTRLNFKSRYDDYTLWESENLDEEYRNCANNSVEDSDVGKVRFNVRNPDMLELYAKPLAHSSYG